MSFGGAAPPTNKKSYSQRSVPMQPSACPLKVCPKGQRRASHKRGAPQLRIAQCPGQFRKHIGGDEFEIIIVSSQTGGCLDVDLLAQKIGEERERPLLVLCTYASDEVAERAAVQAQVEFDLALYDEAHNIRAPRAAAPVAAPAAAPAAAPIPAPQRRRYGSRSVSLPAQRRVIFTATPTKTCQDIAPVVMYEMSWQEAIAGGCILPVEIRGICVKSEIGAALALNSAEGDAVVKDGYPERADRLTAIAQALALLKAQSARSSPQEEAAGAEEEDQPERLRKTFCFHSTNKRARAFARILELAKGSFEFDGEPPVVVEISGLDCAEAREEKLRRFADAERAILANCYICQEGVDVPGCDSVLVCDARRSTVALLQIAGRCMRLALASDFAANSGKKRGVFLLPLFIVDSEWADWEEYVHRASIQAAGAHAPAAASGSDGQRPQGAPAGAAPPPKAAAKRRGRKSGGQGAPGGAAGQQQEPERPQDPGKPEEPPKKKARAGFNAAAQLQHNSEAAVLLSTLIGKQMLIAAQTSKSKAGTAHFKIANFDGEAGGAADAAQVLEALTTRCLGSGDKVEKRFETMQAAKRDQLQTRPVRSATDAAQDALAQSVAGWRKDWREGAMSERREQYLDGLCGFEWRLDEYEEQFQASLSRLSEAVRKHAGNLSEKEERELKKIKENLERAGSGGGAQRKANQRRRRLLEEFEQLRELATAEGSQKIEDFFGTQDALLCFASMERLEELVDAVDATCAGGVDVPKFTTRYEAIDWICATLGVSRQDRVRSVREEIDNLARLE